MAFIKHEDRAEVACLAGALLGFVLGIGCMAAALKDSNAYVEALTADLEVVCEQLNVLDPEDNLDIQECR